MHDTPFDSVESAQSYVNLLRETVEEAQQDVRQDIEIVAHGDDGRHLDALRLVDHKLTELHVHLRATARILNDLRMLRRVLLTREEQVQ